MIRLIKSLEQRHLVFILFIGLLIFAYQQDKKMDKTYSLINKVSFFYSEKTTQPVTP
ncbi:MAG: hypothetical protein ABJG41_02750 [Cyclobacteriaceae bacterium]